MDLVQAFKIRSGTPGPAIDWLIASLYMTGQFGLGTLPIAAWSSHVLSIVGFVFVWYDQLRGSCSGSYVRQRSFPNQ